MSIELTLLIWSTTLAGAYIGVQSLLYRFQYGLIHAASARDKERPANELTGRGARALSNLLETYVVFVALAIAIELSSRSNALTQWGAHLYFWARWAYLPLYIFGVPFLRSLVWLVSAGGLIAMFLGLIV